MNNYHSEFNQDFLDQTTSYIFDSYFKKFGFKQFETIKEEIKEGKKITVTETILGFYIDENRHSGFIHWEVNKELLPNGFKSRLDSLKKIEAIFEGETYTLVKRDDKSFAINSNLFRNIKETIALIDDEFPFHIKENQVTEDGTLVAVIMNEGSMFIIAGMLGYEDCAEGERAVLRDKVDAAHPFFNFAPYKKVDWTTLKTPKGVHFESLSEILLSKQKNLIDIQSLGKTNASDRGRDFIVKERTMDLDGKSKEIKWLVQCKFSENSISPQTVPDWTNRVIEHNVDGYWLITNNDLTPNLFDQLKDSSNNPKIKIETRIWQRIQFDSFFNLHPNLFTKDNFE